ncbi:MAG TPA: ATPase [Planctomycetaceae bacterium]|nr:ATPase [Planctomycetaceae bacterium]
MEKVVFGKTEAVRFALTALFAGEHLLLEDIPGVGKTLLAHAIARSVSGSFHRVQFTPDLLPADITGSSYFDEKQREFRFAPGPIFTNILLADEINRTTPRTQSAMLEAMNEGQVSIDGKTMPLPKPFMVVATENPMEFEGTYPLPESQLDRFLLRVSIGYPDRKAEMEVLHSHQLSRPIDSLGPVVDSEQILRIQAAAARVTVDETIYRYVLDLAEATRQHESLFVGVSTRGVIALSRAIRAYALIEGRDFVVPDDVKTLAVPVLSHRVVPKGYGHGNIRQTVESLIEQIIDTVPVPA